MSTVTFYFKDRLSSVYPWLVVNKIHSSVLPPQEHQLIQIPGRVAQYHVGKTVGIRQEKLEVTILADSQLDRMNKKRMLAEWLNSDESERFYYSFDPDKEYQAVLDGDTDLDKIVFDGATTLTFLLPDPHAYGKEVTIPMYDAGEPYDQLAFYSPFTDVDSNGVADGFTKIDPVGATTAFTVVEGSQVIHVTAATVESYPAIVSDLIPCSPGEEFQATSLIKIEELQNNFQGQLAIVWLDALNGFLALSAAPAISSNTNDFNNSSTGNVVAPVGAAKLQIKLEANVFAVGDTGKVSFKQIGLYKKNVTTPDDGISVNINNSVSVRPKLHYEFTANTTEFAIMHNDRYLYFGQPAEQGGQSNGDSVNGAPQRTQILHDNGSSVAGYTSGIAVDGGTIAGTLTSNGAVFLCNDYGDDGANPKWHGPARVKTLGGATELQDFTLQAELAFKASHINQVGRIEIYLLSISNAIIGKIAIRDSSGKFSNPYLEARAGTDRFFVNYTGKVGRWANFGGPIRLTRKGQVWEFSASKRNSQGKLYDTFTYRLIDKDDAYQTKLAGFQIHIGKYGTNPSMTTAHIDDIQVWNENTINPVTQVPYVFETGDTLDIDNSSGEILKNGEPFYYALEPTSQFLQLDQGVNNLKIFPRDVTNATIIYRERWL